MKIKELFETVSAETYTNPQEYVKFLYTCLVGRGLTVREADEMKAIKYDEETKTIIVKVFHPRFPIAAFHNGEFPFQFADFTGDTFECMGKLKSLKNFPKRLNQNFEVLAPVNSDFTGGPEYVGKRYKIYSDDTELKNLKVTAKLLYLDCPNLEKLSGFSKSEITEIHIADGRSLKGNFLSVLRIKGLEKITVLSGVQNFSECQQAINIINKYLKQGNANIIECQEELFKNNLDQFAKL